MNNAYKYLSDKISNNDTLVVAISGGPDSMALLHLILSLRKDKNIKIICAHVNHNTGRIGQLEEEEYVRNFCIENNIIFELMKIESYESDNFESQARDKRYNFFEELINKYGSKYLLTAHHGDDLIETILMRIVRGSSLRGYAGFKMESVINNYTILRPLICVTKDEIITYNERNNIKYFIDNTNYDDNYTRNRYRKYILPKLKEENKHVNIKFYEFSKNLLECSNYIEITVNKIYSNIYNDNKLNLDELKNLDKFIAIRVLSKILDNIYKEKINLLNKKHLENIYNLAISNKSNSKLSLPNNINVIKKYSAMSFEKNVQVSNYKYEINNDIKLENDNTIKIVDSSETDSNFICRLNKNDVCFPLFVRNKKDGDKMYVKGLNGRKKVKDIFIDSKIPMIDREKWPIVVDSNDVIVWIPGLKKSKFDKTKQEKYDIIFKYQLKEDL